MPKCIYSFRRCFKNFEGVIKGIGINRRKGVGALKTIEALERKLDQLMKEPSNSQIFNDVGVLLYQVKDWKNAEMYFLKAYQLNPTSADILYNYAVTLHHLGHLKKAIPIYEAYLELSHKDKEVIQKMGNCYYQLGEYQLAAKMYE